MRLDRRHFRPAAAAAAVAALVAAVPAGTAHAAWGPVLRPPASRTVSQVRPSVNGRGDAAVGWVEQRGRTTRIRVSVARAGGTMRTRTVRAVRDRGVQGLATAIDARGEVTVAWVERRTVRGLQSGRITVRAAYRMRTRWPVPRVVSATSAFAYAEPRLAVAPNGTVALTFNAAVRAAPGVGAAWRAPGRPFGRVQSVATGRRVSMSEPTLAFDSIGRGYLAGSSRCEGALFVAPAGARRFGARRTIAAAPANHLRFVVTGPASGASAWVRSACSSTEDLSGPVQAAVMTGARWGGSIAVTQDPSTGPVLSGGPRGTAELSFTRFGAESPPLGDATIVRLAPDAAIAPPPAPALAGGWSAVVANAPGDQLVVPRQPANTGPSAAIGARPAGDGPVEQAPLAGHAFYATAAAPFGAALVAARPGETDLAFSVWRPAGV